MQFTSTGLIWMVKYLIIHSTCPVSVGHVGFIAEKPIQTHQSQLLLSLQTASLSLPCRPGEQDLASLIMWEPQWLV